jgi:large subunit ribosomal protein L23
VRGELSTASVFIHIIVLVSIGTMATQRAIRPPIFGKKQVFLYASSSSPVPIQTTLSTSISPLTVPRPNFVLTLLRTPSSPPNFATFLVPLSLNKLDLRDYLFHAYGIRVYGVRSYIQMKKITQDKPGSKRPKPRKWFRPKSIKKMMVEMERPFVWPEEPKEFDLYVLMIFLKEWGLGG